MKIFIAITGGIIALIGLLIFGFHIGGDNDHDRYENKASKFYQNKADGSRNSDIKDITYKNRGNQNQSIKCGTGGCSGELCLDADKVGDTLSTCEFKEEYRCRINCKARNNICSFDTAFERRCSSCVRNCEAAYRDGQIRELCYQGCFGK